MIDMFVSAVAGFSSRQLAFGLVASGGASITLIVIAFRHLRWIRMIEDVPTSRARSATQGYVELQGDAELMDGPPILAPMSRREVAWWSLRVEKRSGDRWKQVSFETSDALFYLRDATGVCIVDPDGANITTPHKRTSRGGRPSVTLIGGLGGLGGEYRYHERLLLPGDHLFVIGQFRTHSGIEHWDHDEEMAERLRDWKRDQDALLQRFDANRDGKIDLQEWELARRAARDEVRREHREMSVQPGVNVIGAPADRRPFLIAAARQDPFTRHLRRRALASSIGALASGAIALGMLAVRL